MHSGPHLTWNRPSWRGSLSMCLSKGPEALTGLFVQSIWLIISQVVNTEHLELMLGKSAETFVALRFILPWICWSSPLHTFYSPIWSTSGFAFNISGSPTGRDQRIVFCSTNVFSKHSLSFRPLNTCCSEVILFEFQWHQTNCVF